ncbi:hypothetical protein [Arundinibacter roseus]|uniref:Outer membrane protein beta-barrel domain-containing protein n=1 Tax=Arundinibacter roseus TaxID=2070510 RepID=A0A4R4K3V7_9BACT|nr:hypothetical protein [Arundinibacter roseus]TDB61111.1 hypothetical protein EZE20_19785 [Arundinibacter roseus]
MKNILIALLTTFTLHAFASESDSTNKVYFSGGANGGILSFASVRQGGESVQAVPRYTLFFNVGTNLNIDASPFVGFFSGVNLSNVGMITRYDNDVKLKQRVYAVGVPLGIKFGKLDNAFGYGGVEAAFALNYKEKLFIDGDKVDKFNEWFSNRSTQVMPSVFVGFQKKGGFGVKAQYYLSNFLNPDFQQNGVKPYQGIESRIFFVTVSYSFDNIRFLH